jgi:hypothetical protein
MSINHSAPDLTIHPPRGPRVRLGGYVILPRMLDKGRASLEGRNGPYHYNCPLDQRFTGFAGVDADALLEQLKQGKSDGDILIWIAANAKNQPKPWDIHAWSTYAEAQVAGDVETKEFFTGEVAKLSKTREDILTWFDLLDVDDYVTYGGQA